MSEPKRSSAFRRLLPYSPFRAGPGSGLGSSFTLALSVLKRAEPLCPRCREGKLEVHRQADDAQAVYLVCNACGAAQNIAVPIGEVAGTIDRLREGERRFLIAAVCAVAFGFVYFFTMKNVYTLIAAGFFAFFLLANAMTFRFRVWQMTHRQFYADGSSLVSKWLRYEFEQKP